VSGGSLVATLRGEILGYACGAVPRAASVTVKHSIYVHHAHLGRWGLRGGLTALERQPGRSPRQSPLR